jgi:hypothetical protein
MSPINNLSDRSVVLALQEFTEVGAPLPMESQSEARQLIESLLAAGPPSGKAQLDKIINSDETALTVARRLLDLTAEDPDTEAVITDITSEPPRDDQMSADVAITSVVVLAALITWLQTKIEIKVQRKDGKVDFVFHLLKEKSSDGTIQSVIETINRTIGYGI